MITVSDNGPGWPEGSRISEEETSGSSVGLSNLYRRMRLTFGEAAELRLYDPPEGGAAIELRFPYQFGA